MLRPSPSSSWVAAKAVPGFVLFLALIAFSVPSASAETYRLPLFVAGTDVEQKGMLRLDNDSAVAGAVSVYAFDDAGNMFGPATLMLEPHVAVELGAAELASRGLGTIEGDVRLEIETDLDINVYAYLQTSDGALSVLHDEVRPQPGSEVEYQYDVPIFRPSANSSMVESSLRLTNPGSVPATIKIVDGAGSPVTLMLAAGTARSLSAVELEGGATGLAGQLTPGVTDPELTVYSDQPIEVVNLARAGGRIDNLSSSSRQGLAPADQGLFGERFVGATLSTRSGPVQMDIRILKDEAFEDLPGEVGEGNSTTSADSVTDDVGARSGGYAYRRTSDNAGQLTLKYTDGDACAMNLYFTSRKSGWYATRCQGGDADESVWYGGSWSTEDADTTTPDPGELRFVESAMSKDYTVGTAIPTLRLPLASGGSGTLVYSINGDVPGLTFDAVTRELTGTPTSAGVYDITYSVMDSSVTATMSLRITVSGGQSGACALGLVLSAGESCVYPGSTEALTVSDDGAEVRFLIITSKVGINVPNRNYRGTIYDLQVKPAEEAGSWRIIRLMDEELPEPDTQPTFGSLGPLDDQIYRVSEAITALTLPSASGGNGTLSYRLSPAVAGLTFDAASRRLSGTPTQSGTQNLTYTATDEDGDPVSLNFKITVRDVEKPDLTVSVSANDSTLAPEQSFTLTARVRNTGGADAEETLVFFYVSEDMTLSIDNDTGLGNRSVAATSANDNERVALDLQAPSGQGVYYYFACAGAVLSESDRSNNCSAPERVVVAEETGAPDLVVSVTSSETSVAASASFRLTAHVRNQGEAQSSSTRVRYLLSSDATITASDTEVSGDNVALLAPNSDPALESDSVRAPSSAGTYYYGACVVSVEGEENTGNNCSNAVRITVTESTTSGGGSGGGSTPTPPKPDPVPTQGPDLRVSSARVSDSAPEPNAPFTLTIQVRNGGNQPSGQATVRVYESSDSRITMGDKSVDLEVQQDALENGKSSEPIEVTLTAPSAPGTYYYGACVDLVVNELNTGNNCSTGQRVRVTVPGPNLAVTASVSNTRPRAGQTITLRATIRNIGDASADGTTLTFYQSVSPDIRSGTSLNEETIDVDGLSRGRSSSKSYSHKLGDSEVGTSYYGACVSPPVSGDPDTSNDCSAPVKVTVPGIDLVVDQAEVDDATPEVGDRFELSVRIRNQGITDAPSATLTYYRSDDATITRGDDPVGSESVKSLDRGESDEESQRITAATEAGANNYYGACVVVVGDADTTNNCSAGVLVTVGAPDLVVESPSVDDRTPEAGDRFRLTVRVRNIGHVEAPSTTLNFYQSIDDEKTGEQELEETESVSSLDINETSSETGRLTAPTTPGEYYVYACTEDVEGESNTDNNCSTPFKITVPAPDLTVDRPRASDTTPDAGERFTLTVRIRNRGAGSAAGTTLNYCRVDEKPDEALTTCANGFDTDSVSGLDASRSDEEDVSIDAPSEPGTYYYYACVDAVAGESKNDNNCSTALTVTVPPPDLVVQSPRANPRSLEAGDRFELSVTVRNLGRGSAGAGSLLTYYEAASTDPTNWSTLGLSDTIGALAPSESSTESVDVTVPGIGTFYYRACVTDVDNEEKTDNNCSSRVSVTVR